MEEAGRKLFETSLYIFFVISYEAFSVLKLKVKGKKMPLGFKRGIRGNSCNQRTLGPPWIRVL